MKKVETFMPQILVLLVILIAILLCTQSCVPRSQIELDNRIIEKCVVLNREMYNVTSYKLLRVSDNTIHYKVIHGPQRTIQDTVLVAFDKRYDYETPR